MPLDAQAQVIVDLLTSVFPDVGGAVTDPVVARRMLAEQTLAREPEPIARVDHRVIPGPDGNEIPVRISWPSETSDPLPIVVFLHGGGWALCNLDTHDATCRSIANGTGAIVIAVDYRLAPEHPFPAPFEDAYASVLWAYAHAAELGGDPERMAIAGDSAGGNLAACVAVALRDRGGPPMRAQLLVYPVIDARCDRPSYRDNAEGYFLTAEAMRWFWGHYLGDMSRALEPYACPKHAASLQGLPPATIITAEYDPLRDEAEDYGRALQAAGVAVLSRRYDGMIHGFVSMAEIFEDGRAAQLLVAQRLRAAFA